MKTGINTNTFVVLVPFSQNKKGAVVELTPRQSVFLEMGGFIKLKLVVTKAKKLKAK